LGVGGLLILLVWRLTDKWAGRFLATQEKQAAAMAELATAVKDGLGEQREVLLASRVMAKKLEELADWAKELDQHVRNGVGR